MPEFTPVINVSALNGTNGFRLDGGAVSEGAGLTVGGGTDFNGDGFSDFSVGAHFAAGGGSQRGQAWIVFGAASNPAAQGLAARVSAGTAYQFQGVSDSDQTGYSIANAGDVNGDGLDDLLIGADYANTGGANNHGSTYLVFGGTANLEALDTAFGAANDNVILLSHLTASQGFRFDGINDLDQSGTQVSSAGDLNGDGIGDLIIGARYAEPGAGPAGNNGEAYIVFGGANLGDLDDDDGSADGRIALGQISAGKGLIVTGAQADDQAGFSVASAGDVNGDGFDDVLVGARDADPDGLGLEGAAYLIFGRPQAQFSSVTLSLSGTSGLPFVRFDGAAAGDKAGFSVTGLGDINGDGFADIAIGAPYANNGSSNRGSVHVVFGQAEFAATNNLSALDGSNGFRLDGLQTSGYVGTAISSAGDMNGDGFMDILISEPFKDRLVGPDHGAAYVVFGSVSGFAPVISLGILDGDNGFRIDGAGFQDTLGRRRGASAAGDVNGDGFDDIVIGAMLADNNNLTDSGSTYIIYGHRAETAVTRVGTALDNTINGGKGDDTISGLSGDDALFGWENDDIINGGDGSDAIDGGAGTDSILGGGGDDNIKMSFGFDEIDAGSGKDTLDFRNLSGSANLDMGLGTYTLSQSQDDGTFSEVEQAIMTNGGDTVTGSSRNDIIQAAKGNDTVNGAAGNDFIAGNYGRDTLTGGLGNDTFDYNALSESSTTASIRDIITDFKTSGADKIDLSTLDANATLGGNQAFTFLATLGAAFTAAGQVRYTQSGGNTFVDINTDANLATIEMQVQLTGLKTLVAADFVL